MKNSVFSFQPNSTTGVLQNIFDNPNYWNTFTYHSTSVSTTGYAYHAFNFSTKNYWLGQYQDTPNNLSFCFRFFRVIAQGYEIKTSHHTDVGSLRAKTWGFSGSNDAQNWILYNKTDHYMSPNETYYVEWKSNIPLRCFQLTTLNSVSSVDKNRFDLVHIDVYGYVVIDTKTIQKTLFNIPLFCSFLYQIFTFNSK